MNNIISKSWFYKDLTNTIDIKDNLEVLLFLWDNSSPININVWENTSLKLFWFFTSESPSNLFINQLNNNSTVNTKIIFWNEKSDLKTNFKSYINSSNSKSDVSIVSFIKDKKLHIDSLIEIEENVNSWVWYLNIENIFIWDKWKIKWIPSLLVRSNDIQAWHSCKIHRLDNNKMFYLKSRWLKNENCSNLIVSSYFNNFFWELKSYEIDSIKNYLKEDDLI